MNAISSQLCQHVSARSRVGFVLAIAERVLPALAKNANAFRAAQEALGDGWRWEEGESQRALELYDRHVEALAVQGSMIKDKEASAAMSTATSAFFYMVWHAFAQDIASGLVREGDVPNDMADVTEEVIDEVCDYAAGLPCAIDGGSLRWLNVCQRIFLVPIPLNWAPPVPGNTLTRVRVPHAIIQ